MGSLADLEEQVRSYFPDADLALLRRAYDYTARAHEGQLRRSGAPYLTHPVAVAEIIASLQLDVASICAGLLHDAVEDTKVTVEELKALFGQEIAFLVDGVTKLGKLPYATRKEQQAENFRKMLVAMARDIRVILLKICDRLHNMRTLAHMPEVKQERISEETLHIYAPLANRLGVQWIKTGLEDLSFKYLHPIEYEQLAIELNKTRAERDHYILEVEKQLQQAIAPTGIQVSVSGRAKHLWSIRQKMKRNQASLEEIHDAIGFRVVTGSVGDCYAVLGVIHSKWTPIPGRFKDYIALPKPNLYQSLHTAVIGPKGERIEVQIRTEEMHQIAEHGIAAHWRYKEGKPQTPGDKEFAWLRRLMEAQKEVSDPTEFIESVKVDLFGDEVFVFTPNGDVMALPLGACPIDFAYSIHTNVGHHCSGARVNGMMVPLRYKLRSGDTIEIITSPNQKPNKDWLKLVKTSRARTKIRHKLRQEQRERAQELGRELIEKELRKRGTTLAKAEKNGSLSRAAEALRTHGVPDLILQVGYGKYTALAVVNRALKEEAEQPTSPPQALRRKTTVDGGASAGIIVDGESDVLVRFAKCCSPLPGDVILGYITRGRGVSIHRSDCPKALDIDPERRILVEWGDKLADSHAVLIQVLSTNKPGLLAEISQSFSENKVNINQANCRATDDGKAVNTFDASVQNLSQLKKLIKALQRIQGVYAVERVVSE